MARRPHALPHPIRNQKPPFLVTERSANPIGNQNTAFLVTEFLVVLPNRRFEQQFRGGDPGWLPGVATRRGGRGKGGLPRHRRRSVAGAAAIIRPAAGSNIPEGLSSPACYCPLPRAGSVKGPGLKICLGRHAPTRPPLREESAAVAVAEGKPRHEARPRRKRSGYLPKSKWVLGFEPVFADAGEVGDVADGQAGL